MSEQKWTQGPWEIHGWRILKFGEDHAAIALICDPHFGQFVNDMKEVDWGKKKDDRDIALANAHLIAAAPDLYESLQEMLKWCIWDTDYAERARKAIAKAEGR